MPEPDYIVIRRGPDIPDEWRMPHGLGGRWFDRSTMPVGGAGSADAAREAGVTVGTAQAVPTGRFEYREDGAVAEVWEIRPRYI